MKNPPILKQFGDLTPDDFMKAPVWVSCHSVDYNEGWYRETDEETFRPHSGNLPVDAQEMYLVATSFILSDGRKFRGFATPANEKDRLGIMQPQLFDEFNQIHGFWMGMFPNEEEIQSTLNSLGCKNPFPIRFEANPGLTSSHCSGSIPGFLKSNGDRGPEVIKIK